MSSKKGSKKKEPVTANFAFTFLEARETGVKAGKKVHIQYKRGEKKENHGQTEEVDVDKEGNAKFNKSVSFKVTISPDGDKYETKYLSISLRDVRVHFLPYLQVLYHFSSQCLGPSTLPSSQSLIALRPRFVFLTS